MSDDENVLEMDSGPDSDPEAETEPNATEEMGEFVFSLFLVFVF